MEVDHDRQVVHTETLGLALLEPEALLAAMRPSEEHVASRLTSPIVSTHLDTRNVAFERSVGARPHHGSRFRTLGGGAAHRGCSGWGGGPCRPSVPPRPPSGPVATFGPLHVCPRAAVFLGWRQVRGPRCLDFCPHVFSHHNKDLGCGSGQLFAPVWVSQ